MTLTDFLLARVAEDEAMWRAMPFGPSFGHAELWLRMLTKCEAERRIVELHERYNPESRYCQTCTLTGDDSVEFPCATMRHLAAAYADHPDYREEWKP